MFIKQWDYLKTVFSELRPLHLNKSVSIEFSAAIENNGYLEENKQTNFNWSISQRLMVWDGNEKAERGISEILSPTQSSSR